MSDGTAGAGGQGQATGSAPGGSNLTTRILIALVLGVPTGVLINYIGGDQHPVRELVDALFHVGGQIFLASLKVLVVPLVLVSLICGTSSLDDISKLGRVGGRTLALYLFTTAVAITLAIGAAVLIQPGAGFELTPDLASIQAKEPPPLTETIIDMFPTNPVQAMAEGRMLQVIVFAVLFGLALSLSGPSGARVRSLFEDLNVVVLRLVGLLMNLAPAGVYCLVTTVFSDMGFGAIRPLLWYFVLVLAVLVLHMVVTYPSLMIFVGGLSPRAFFPKLREPMTVAFSTASSGATLPVTLRAVEHRLGVDNSIGSFTVPLGATINMDGTAIMQGVATVFIAQAYGIEIGLGGYLSVVLTATLASIGTAGVPGVGLIMLAMVLRQVGLPVEGIGLIIGIDRLLDMARTAVNITGDAAVSCIVAKSEGQLDMQVFGDPSR